MTDADQLAATGGRYLVISSDCHAGLPNAEYREWLDPEHRETFDTHLAERARMIELAQRGMLNAAFAEEWESENAEGLRGGWDAARRDKELDADGVVGEVIFPDADAGFALRLFGLWTFDGDPYEPVFYAGGAYDLRGYGYSEFSGNNIALTSLELRIPLVNRIDFGFLPGFIIGDIRGVGFFDAGMVWDRRRGEALGDGAGAAVP